MYKPVSKSQYHIGNDKRVPDSAFNPSSYLDGIYTKFDPENAPNGFASIQETFKMNLPQSEWGEPRGKGSELVSSALFTSGYDTAQSVIVDQGFDPDLPTGGRSEYVEKPAPQIF